LEAGLRPDTLGELKRSPIPPSCNKGSLLLRGRQGKKGQGREGKRGARRGQGRRRGGKEGKGCVMAVGGTPCQRRYVETPVRTFDED